MSCRTLPPGSVSSRAGLLISRATSSASTAMDGSRSESGKWAALDGNPDSEGYDVSYCRGAGLLNMNVSRDAFSPSGSPRRSRRWDFGRPAGESRKVDAWGAEISRLNRYILHRASVLSGQPAGGVPEFSTASMARSSSSRGSCSATSGKGSSGVSAHSFGLGRLLPYETCSGAALQHPSCMLQ